jgi:hypothetical protein
MARGGELRMRLIVKVLCVGVALLSGSSPTIAQPVRPAQQPAIYEKKDADGRLLVRVTFRADGTLNHTAFVYGRDSARVAYEVEMDQRRVPVREKREAFDEEGRITESEEISLREGRRQKTTTNFQYDAAGRQTSTTRIE